MDRIRQQACELAKDVLVTPFSAGKLSTSSGSGSFKQDGQISALLVVGMVGVSLLSVMVAGFAKPDSVGVDKATKITLLVTIVAGMVIMFYIGAVYKWRPQWISPPVHHTAPVPSHTQFADAATLNRVITMCCMAIFALGCIVLTVLQLRVDIEYLELADRRLDITYDIVQILFVYMQMVFLATFVKKCFLSTTIMRFYC
jgi:hypothetical protein